MSLWRKKRKKKKSTNEDYENIQNGITFLESGNEGNKTDEQTENLPGNLSTMILRSSGATATGCQEEHHTRKSPSTASSKL